MSPSLIKPEHWITIISSVDLIWFGEGCQLFHSSQYWICRASARQPSSDLTRCPKFARQPNLDNVESAAFKMNKDPKSSVLLLHLVPIYLLRFSHLSCYYLQRD